MNKLFHDINDYRLNDDGRAVSERIVHLFKALYDKYDTGELSYIVMEEVTMQAHAARLDRQRQRREQLENFRVQQMPPVEFVRNAAPAQVENRNMQIPIDWFNVQAPLPFNRPPIEWANAQGLPVNPPPQVADDAEDVEF